MMQSRIMQSGLARIAPGMTMSDLFRRGLERSEVAERNGGQRVGQRGEIRGHLREPRRRVRAAARPCRSRG